MTEMLAEADRAAMPASSISVRDALQQKLNVMHAVILRDIRSRFFDHGLGFLIVPLFPVGHMMILLTVYAIVSKQTAFGDDLNLFFATGLMPALTFTYVSRFMSVSLLANKMMMAFPVVRLLDIVIARAILELVGIILAMALMIVILISLGADPTPRNPGQALLAMSLVAIFAIGMGIIASVITAIVPAFAMVYGLSMIIYYLSSGAPIYLHTFPEQVVYWCSWNPVFHAVEWVRGAYYLGYPDQSLDRGYLAACAFGSLAIGLIMERGLRKQMLAG